MSMSGLGTRDMYHCIEKIISPDQRWSHYMISWVHVSVETPSHRPLLKFSVDVQLSIVPTGRNDSTTDLEYHHERVGWVSDLLCSEGPWSAIHVGVVCCHPKISRVSSDESGASLLLLDIHRAEHVGVKCQIKDDWV